jgi:hypothetical protein
MPLKDKLDRFDEIFEWTFGGRQRAAIIKAGGRFIDYSNTKVQNLEFPLRLLIERIWSCTLLVYLETVSGQPMISRLATTDEDQNLKIDYFDADELPVGHKIRVGYSDAICCRYQPCHGIDDPRTEDGRDFVCLSNHSTVYTQTAIFDENTKLFSKIHKINSDEFLRLVLKLEEDWAHQPLNEWNRTWQHPNNRCQVKWKKVYSENYHKYLFFVPFDEFESHVEIKIPESHGKWLRSLHKLLYERVAARYIRH